ANGTAVNNTTDVTYTPDTDHCGPDSFTYTATDGNGGTDTATVNATITCINDTPGAVDDDANTNEDTAVTIDVLDNDTDADTGDTLSVESVIQPNNGTATNNTVDVTYEPNADYCGPDSFTYTASDGNGGTDTATVNVTIECVNDAPGAVDDDADTNEDTAVTVDVLGNDTDADTGDTLSVESVTQPTNGTVTNNTADVTYDPDTDYCGSDSFTYTASDGNDGTDTATVNVTVTCDNDAPVAADDSETTNEDTTVTIDVLTNDTDVDTGDTLSVESVTQPTNGTAINNVTDVTYEPNTDYCGDDSFTYVVSDGVLTGTATVNVTIECVNDAPVATDDTEPTNEDTAVTVDVLANDTDVDTGDTLNVESVTQPPNGTVINNVTDVTYEPNVDYCGDDSFAYVVSDGVLSDTATVNVTITCVNDIPQVEAGPDQTVDEGGTASFTGSFTDPDIGDTHTVVWDLGDGNTATDTLSPTHVYADNAASGAYTVTLTVTDSQSGVVSDTLLVTVNNVAPTVDAGPDQFTNEGTEASFTGIFTDPGVLDTHTIAWSFGDGYTATGALTPTHTYADDGAYTVILTVTDDDGGTDSDTLIVTVDNVAPYAYAGPDRSVDEGEDVLFDGSFVDPGTVDTHTIEWDFSDGATDSGTLNPIYAYADNGTYTVTLTVTDDDGGMDNDSLLVTVGNVAPTVNAGPDQTVDENEQVHFGGSFTDPGSSDTHTIEWDLGDGTTDTGALTPDHTYAESGAYTVTLTITDDDGGVDSDTLLVTVEEVGEICELYPIALHTNTLAGVEIGEEMWNIRNGSRPGNFGWLSWTGDPSVPTLVQSLTPPGDSYTYVNPNDPNDHVLSTGDWVHGKPGVCNARSVRDALDGLKDTVITVPVWDVADGWGNNAEYHVVGYARVQITDYRLPWRDRISAVYWGNATCDVVVDTPPVAVDDSVATPENTPVTVDVLANDYDENGDPLTLIVVGQLLHGTAVANPDGTVNYTPPSAWHGTDSFTYTIAAGADTDTATVAVTVRPPDEWQYGCDANGLQVAVIGTGMGHHGAVEHNPQTLTIADPDSATSILAQVMVNAYGSSPPNEVRISSGLETHELLDPVSVKWGHYYEVPLQPDDQITAEVVGNVGKKPRAFMAYVFRHGDGGRASSGRLIHEYIYQDSHTEVVSILPAPFSRDVEVTFVVADVADDSRKVVMRAQAGDVVREATMDYPNQGSELLIYTLTLPNVPGDADSVTTTLMSPSCGGDSLFWSGINVRVGCSASSSGEGRVTDNLQVLYTFQEESGMTVYDVSGVGTPLNLTIGDTGTVDWLPERGLSINASTLIASNSSATKIIDAAQATGELTLEAWIKPANVTQDGPARIVTLSKNPGKVNFTLGQGLWGSRPSDVYDVRLRTSHTNRYGMPSVTTPAGSATTDLSHVVYTRDAAGVARIYVDGVEMSHRTVGGHLNWANCYRLALANELTGDRPWLGEFYLVAVYNRALTSSEVNQNYDDGLSTIQAPTPPPTPPVPPPTPVPTDTRVTENLQVLYTFQEGQGEVVHDVSEAGTPLDLEIGDAGAVRWLPDGGLAVEAPTIIASDDAATKVIDASRATDELTVEAWVKPANVTQDGPARLVTLSKNSRYRNFTLGQGLWGNRPSDIYNMRLRTTATSKNGVPSVSTPAGSLMTELSHVVYTRGADGTVRIYVDGVQVASETVGGDFSNWRSHYRLGLVNELTQNRPWLGDLYLVAVYNRALTSDEVSQNYGAGLD
ncbi:MAG: tandem-95 repeat protein, partial [Chloroflexi bacterium]|nr:tandem-95 repeat protein [Chloroflexota bacterium]